MISHLSKVKDEEKVGFKNGKIIAIEIASKNKKRPEPIELINEIKYKWKILPNEIKIIYVKSAIELGFNPKQLFSNNPEMRAKLDLKIL